MTDVYINYGIPGEPTIENIVDELRAERANIAFDTECLQRRKDREKALRDQLMNAMYNGHSRTIEHNGLQVVIKRTKSIDADPEMLRDELAKLGILDEHLRLDLTAAKKTGAKLKLASVTTTTRDVLSVKEIDEDESSDGQRAESEAVSALPF